MKKLLTLTFFYVFFLHTIIAQFNLIGTTTLLSDRTYRMTEDKSGQFGALWSKDKIDLNQSFDIVTRINFGANNSSGADGLVFVLGGNNTYLNTNSGSDFGVFGLTPSLSVEFDNFQSPGYFDPSFDHVSIQKNGTFQHNFTNTLAGPAQTIPSNSNIEDGKEHSIRFAWNASSKIFKLYVDCSERLSLTNDIVKTIFNNQNQQFWGFSAACGSQSNEQTITIERASMLDQFNEKTLCLGETTQLYAAHPANGVVSWLPNNGSLSSNFIYNPICSTKKTELYLVNNTHQCALTYNDTFKIIVPQLIPTFFPKDTTLCEKQILKLNVGSLDAKNYLWNDGSKDSTLTISSAGTYAVTTTDGNCFWKNIVAVAYNPLPTLQLGKDTSICANQNVLLSAQNLGASYLWSNGEKNSQITVNQTNTYWVSVTSDKGCGISDTIKIIAKPIFNTSQKVTICAGDFYTFAGKNWTTDTIVCQKYASKNTCDSTHCVTIKVKPIPVFSFQKSICKGDFFEFNKKKYFDTGIFTDTLTAKNGCDSIVVIALTTIKIDTVSIKEFICEKSSYTIGTQTFQNAGVYKVKLKDQQTGCDSIVLLNLKVIPLRGFSGKDTICEGENVKFGTKTYNKSGFFEEKLKNVNGCDSLIDFTLLVIPTPKVKISTKKAAFCEGGSTELFATAATTKKFDWSNGQTGSNIIANKAGVYKVFIEGTNGCKGSDSLLIRQSPPINFDLVPTPPSCSGYTDGKITLKNIIGGLGVYSSQLNKGQFGNSLTFEKLKEGTYKVIVRDTLGCESEQSVGLVNPQPKSMQLADKQRIIKLGDSTIVELITNFTDIMSVTWLPNERLEKISNLETWLKPVTSQYYKVSVKDNSGCIFNDSLQVIVNDAVNVFVPNIFSPNADGTNDDLRILAGFGVEKILYFGIYDRWSNQVFEAQDYSPLSLKGWNGTFRDRDVEEGVYTYIVKVLKKNNKEEILKGDVMLIR